MTVLAHSKEPEEWDSSATTGALTMMAGASIAAIVILAVLILRAVRNVQN
jgi:hypothetical protein